MTAQHSENQNKDTQHKMLTVSIKSDGDMLCTAMLSVIMMSVVMLSVIMLSVIMLSVVMPSEVVLQCFCQWQAFSTKPNICIKAGAYPSGLPSGVTLQG